MKLTLDQSWKKRNELISEGDKLWFEGARLRAKGDRLWTKAAVLCPAIYLAAEKTKLEIEGDRLQSEGFKFWTEGNTLWSRAVLEIKNSTQLEWHWMRDIDNFYCVLDTGEVFEP